VAALGSPLNLRAGPGVEHQVLKALADGAELRGQEYAWRRVVLEDGTVGWIASQYLEREEAG
jgi:SH3-like domain-containing protein